MMFPYVTLNLEQQSLIMKVNMSLDRLDRVKELGEAPEVGLRLMRGRHGDASASVWSCQ